MGLAHDSTKVAKIVSEIHNALDALTESASKPVDEFTVDRQQIAACKYFLIVWIEGCLDLANHLIAKNKYRIPQDYADTFHILMEKGIVDKGLGNRLMEMARFRNRLIHIYWDIEDERIHTFLQEDLDDVPAFIEIVLERIR